jgi:F0F1-type ATP synthase beta subunit
MSNGNIVQCIGAVVDIQFPRNNMPKIYDALKLTRGGSLVLEVQQQLGGKMERECSAGCVVVASKEFPFRADGPFRLLEMAAVPMSWSADSKARVYRRI